jgi:predicted MFS family arabinose efflux permease
MQNSSPATGEFSRGWPILLSAMFGIALGLSPMPFYTIGIFAPELVREFHWNYAQIMFGITITTFAVLIASPLVGLAADRFGVRRVAMTSVVIFGLSFMAFSQSTGSLPLYYATWGITAFLGAGTLPITWTRAVNNAFQVRKGLALGIALIGTGLFGYSIKPVAAWLITNYGWRLSYVAIGALPLIIALPLAWFCFHDPGQRTQEGLIQTKTDTPGLTVSETLRDWRFWLIGCCFLAMAFAIGGLVPNMENILRIAKFDKPNIVTLTSLIGLSVIGGRVIGGWLIDRFWAPGISVVILAAPAIACLVLAHGDLSYHGAMASIVAIGLATGVEFDLLAFLVARYFGMKSYGAIYGGLYSFYALGAGLGPVAFGANFDRTAGYVLTLTLSSGLFFGPALLLLLLGKYRNFEPA